MLRRYNAEEAFREVNQDMATDYLGAEECDVHRAAVEAGSVCLEKREKLQHRACRGSSRGNRAKLMHDAHSSVTGNSVHKWQQCKIPAAYKEAVFHSEDG